ncbi:hypothetical protein, partial [Pseudoscardovia radai]|uniref:hypothetical protein n=1 Tax=Pseudoscardovia radai TaxID=987066 RepID=UPI003994B0F1
SAPASPRGDASSDSWHNENQRQRSPTKQHHPPSHYIVQGEDLFGEGDEEKGEGSKNTMESDSIAAANACEVPNVTRRTV